MSIEVVTPDVAGLVEAAGVLRGWQTDRGEMHLHPGDLGWHWRDGSEQTAAAVRVWTRDGRVVALGMLDAPQLLRMAIDPTQQTDSELVDRVMADIDTPSSGVLDAGSAIVEARCGPRLRTGLVARGWVDDESWRPLHLDLAGPVRTSGLRVEPLGADGVDEWLALHRSAFRPEPMSADELRIAHDRWLAMAASPPFADARFLTAYDDDGAAVAVAGVWSAGPGRPGLLEPIGVAPGHRGRGHGRAVTIAAAGALRELGASSATVCTPTANPGAVQTYVAAGFERFPAALDVRRG